MDAAIRRLLLKGTGTKAVVRELGTSPSVIIRIKREMGLPLEPSPRKAEAGVD
jgi:hypothetical protein